MECLSNQSRLIAYIFTLTFLSLLSNWPNPWKEDDDNDDDDDDNDLQFFPFLI